MFVIMLPLSLSTSQFDSQRSCTNMLLKLKLSGRLTPPMNLSLQSLEITVLQKKLN